MPAPSTSGRTQEFTPEPLRTWGKTWRVLVAILVGLTGLISLAELPADREFMIPVDLIFGVIVFTLMFFRRRWPFVVAVLSVILGSFSGLAAGATIITIISLATRRRWVEVIPVGVLFIAGGLAYLALLESDAAPLLYVSSEQDGTLIEESLGPWWLMALFLLLSFAVLAAIGLYIGARRELIFNLQQRVATAEREQVAREDQARTAERSRIAREMHDVLAHRISLVAMHSGALTYRTNLTGAEMQATAEIIRDNAHLALTELRDVLGVLRDSENGPEIAPPQPTLGSLPELVELTASTGTDVELRVAADVEEHLASLPEFISRTAYRIVQEALTNVLKHAHGRPTLLMPLGLTWRPTRNRGAQPKCLRSAHKRRNRNVAAVGHGSDRIGRARHARRRRTQPRRGPCRGLRCESVAAMDELTTDMAQTASPEPGLIRVVLVDDDPLVRAGLRMILGGDSTLEIVGEADDGIAAHGVITSADPDVVLMDIRMPRLDGLEATKNALAALPELKVIVLTTFDTDDMVLTALRVGASGFLLKDTPPEQLVKAIHRAADGDPILSPSVTAQLIANVARTSEDQRGDRARARLDLLTDREREVAIAIGRGLSNSEIAEELFMSVPTVKSHVGKLFAKLEADNRVQIAICAHEASLD